MKCSENCIQLEINDLVIRGVPQENNTGYEFSLVFNDGNAITINGSQVKITENISEIPYIVDI